MATPWRDRLAYWLERKVAPGSRLGALLYADQGINYRGKQCWRNRVNGHVVVGRG